MPLKYSLDSNHYSIKNALLWGNFKNHAKKSRQGTWHSRAVHGMIATAEFLPVIGQTASLIEFAVFKIFAHKNPNSSSRINHSVHSIPEEDPLSVVIDALKDDSYIKNPIKKTKSTSLPEINTMSFKVKLDPLDTHTRADHAKNIIQEGIGIFINPQNTCDHPNCGLHQFNCMAAYLLDTPKMHVNLHGGRIASTNERYDYELPKDNKASFYFYGACLEGKDAFDAAFRLRAMNQERMKNGELLITRMYLPLVCSGGVSHGILACIELDLKNSRKVEITVIDPLGAKSPYKGEAIKYVKQIQKVFKPSKFDVKVIHNKKRTQFDMNCGYHQILNTMHLNYIDNVQNYITNNHLPIRKKEAVEAFYNEDMVPIVKGKKKLHEMIHHQKP